MARSSRDDVEQVRAIRAELDTLRLDHPPVLDIVLPQLRSLLRTEAVVAICMRPRAKGWTLDLFHHHGFQQPEELHRAWLSFMEGAPRQFAWYDPLRPEPEQRNRVLEAVERIPPGEYESSRIYQELMAPMRLQHHRQLRALVCDGPALLAWFGAFHPERVDASQKRLLRAVVPSVRHRLAIERRLRSATAYTIAVALEHFAAAAFLLDRNGQVLTANEPARALLADSYIEVSTALRDAVAHRPSNMIFELSSVRENGTPAAWLAILRSTPAATTQGEPAFELRLAGAARHWGITRRELDVLRLLVIGDANKEIAVKLRCHEGSVERHVTSLLQKARCDGRSRLVARFWTLER